MALTKMGDSGTWLKCGAAGEGKDAMTDRVEWTIDVRATALFVIASVLVVTLFAFLHRGSGEMKWSLVPGTMQDTRIIPDHGLETKWGGELTWKAEYRVDYSVATRNYAVWADSGIRGESETGIRMALPQSRLPCRVRSNPKKPEASIADCR
jgi:hypothetical protein